MSFRMAEKMAKQSSYVQHRVGAVVVKGGRILSTGFNSRQPSSMMGTSTRHAETAAILKMLKERRGNDLVGADMYVSRFTRGGRIGLARPCPACHKAIRAVGIRKVYYTTDCGVEELKL